MLQEIERGRGVMPVGGADAGRVDQYEPAGKNGGRQVHLHIGDAQLVLGVAFFRNKASQKGASLGGRGAGKLIRRAAVLITNLIFAASPY